MSLDIAKLIEKKRKTFSSDSDYIEELERMLYVTDEAYENTEIENNKFRERIAVFEKNQSWYSKAINVLSPLRFHGNQLIEDPKRADKLEGMTKALNDAEKFFTDPKNQLVTK